MNLNVGMPVKKDAFLLWLAQFEQGVWRSAGTRPTCTSAWDRRGHAVKQPAWPAGADHVLA